MFFCYEIDFDFFINLIVLCFSIFYHVTYRFHIKYYYYCHFIGLHSSCQLKYDLLRATALLFQNPRFIGLDLQGIDYS